MNSLLAHTCDDKTIAQSYRFEVRTGTKAVTAVSSEFNKVTKDIRYIVSRLQRGVRYDGLCALKMAFMLHYSYRLNPCITSGVWST